jgi:molecular chaperone DnaJ
MQASARLVLVGACLALLAGCVASAGKDPYTVLGVTRSATDKELKRAHQRLAMRWHPDKNQGDKGAQDKFVEAQHAYELLSDAEKRRHYDHTGFADPQEVSPHPST